MTRLVRQVLILVKDERDAGLRRGIEIQFDTLSQPFA
jgi:hypothetical protein